MEVTQLSNVVETVTELAEPILAKHGCYLYHLEFVKEGKSWYLRVYVDKDGGVTLEDCADISDELSEALDNTEPDPIPQAYFLEVSSPGAERPLKKEADYERAVNDYIHISLYQQVEGKKVYEGTLVDLKPDELTLEYMDKTRRRQVKIDRKVIAQARLAIDFSKI